MTKLTILPAARRDIAEAREWYEHRSAGLGDDFVARVDAALLAIQRNPESHAAVFEDFRRSLVKRFPYEVLEDRVVVYAVTHGSQDPSKWRKRLS